MSIREELFEAMRNDIFVMSEFGDSEPDLWEELQNSDIETICEYLDIYTVSDSRKIAEMLYESLCDMDYKDYADTRDADIDFIENIIHSDGINAAYDRLKTL